jgi:hypothetical protein
LRLLGLAGLGLEAVDELLQVGDLVLLLGERRLLQFHLLGAQFLELAVVAAVAGQLGVVDVQRHVGDRVQEFAVVADDDHRAGIALQPAFQPDQGVQVQVVGGFVQQQQVGRAHQRAGQLQAHAPAARKAVDRVVQLAHLEAQAQDQRLGAGFGVVLAGVMPGRCRHGPWPCRRPASAPAVRPAARSAGCRRRGRSRWRCSSVSGMFCATCAMRQPRGRSKSPPSSCRLPLSSANRVDLPAPLRPDQADFFAGVDDSGGAVEQHLRAAAKDYIFQDDHGAGGCPASASRVTSST